MSVVDGAAHIESHYTASQLSNVRSFEDLHEYGDPNESLPFGGNGGDEWVTYITAVIDQFNQNRISESV